MTSQFALYGLDGERSRLVLQRLLFSPLLTAHLGSDLCAAWCNLLIDMNAQGSADDFVDAYEGMEVRVKEVLRATPRFTLANPPWAMLSLDMFIGIVPWLTPSFGQILKQALSSGLAVNTPFGKLLAVALILHGGPGTTKETAIRVTAPSQGVRAFAEHWLMRAYANVRANVLHATLMPDEYGRQYSYHQYLDENQTEVGLYFSTTQSFDREEEDFDDFLHWKLDGERAPLLHRPSLAG